MVAAIRGVVMHRQTEVEPPSTARGQRHTLYRFRFDNVDYDESVARLLVGGVAVPLEPRPRAVLSTLLRHAGATVPKADLLNVLWEGRVAVDNVVANAINKLRRAVGAPAAARIINVPRVGYRLDGPVERTVLSMATGTPLRLEIGADVPGRPGLRLQRSLGQHDDAPVWLAYHAKLQQSRVFKFASDGATLASLQREYTVYRVLRKTLDRRDDFVEVISANFTDAPYFLESEFGGDDFAVWAAQDDRLANLTEPARVALFLQIARAVAAAHSVGVLHKDLKPANVLVSATGDGWQVKLTDFGSSRLLDPARLVALGVTAMGMTVTYGVGEEQRSGTPLYLAPELIAGQSPSTRSDVYALGLMLYQLLVGDLRRPMSTGWQRDIADPLLRDDVTAATEGRPGDRLGSVGELIERLASLVQRRSTQAAASDASARADAMARELARRTARRPWVVAAFLALSIGLVTTLWFVHQSRAFLRDAREATAQAQRITDFLHRDVLDAPDVVIVGTAHLPSILDVMRKASAAAQASFTDQPKTEAALHRRMAETYLRMASLVDAGAALERAIALLTPLVPPDDAELLICHFLRARLLVWTQGAARAADELTTAERIAGPHLQAKDEVAYNAMRSRYAYAIDRGDNAAAVPLGVRLVTLADGLFAAGAPATAEARRLLAEAEYNAGSPAAAERHLAELARPPFSEPHAAAEFHARNSSAAAHKRALALSAQGDYAGAARAVADARADLSSVGTRTTTLAVAWMDLGLGCAEAAQGKWSDAGRVLDTAASEFADLLGAEHQYVQTARLLGAMTQTALGDPAGALVHYDAVAHWRGQHTAYWPWAPLLRFGRAAALTRSGHPRESLAVLADLRADDFGRIPFQGQWAPRITAEQGLALMAIGRGDEGRALVGTAADAMAAAHGWPSLIADYRAALDAHTVKVAATAELRSNDLTNTRAPPRPTPRRPASGSAGTP